MTTRNTALGLKAAMVIATGTQLLMFSSGIRAQVNPRGIPPVPASTDPAREPDRDRLRIGRGDAETPGGRPTLNEIKHDFVRIQELNDGLPDLLKATPLDYSQIGEVASKIKSVATRLDSNLVLGQPKDEKPHNELEFSDETLRLSLSSLHDLVVRFVENPVFTERGVFDIEQTKRAKQDVDGIIAVSDHIKKIASRLRKRSK